LGEEKSGEGEEEIEEESAVENADEIRRMGLCGFVTLPTGVHLSHTTAFNATQTPRVWQQSS
jgi:hypothetical protein